jgi:hypothetical protein
MSTYPAGVKYITGDMPEGVSLGKDSTDLVSLHGVTPIAQQTLPAAATTAVTTPLFNEMRTLLLNLGAGKA